MQVQTHLLPLPRRRLRSSKFFAHMTTVCALNSPVMDMGAKEAEAEPEVEHEAAGGAAAGVMPGSARRGQALGPAPSAPELEAPDPFRALNANPYLTWAAVALPRPGSGQSSARGPINPAPTPPPRVRRIALWPQARTRTSGSAVAMFSSTSCTASFPFASRVVALVRTVLSVFLIDTGWSRFFRRVSGRECQCVRDHTPRLYTAVMQTLAPVADTAVSCGAESRRCCWISACGTSSARSC